MKLILAPGLTRAIERHGVENYPEEAAGLLLGNPRGEDRYASRLLALDNKFQAEQRNRRYLIEPKDMIEAEKKAEELELDILGVFHSHPDHPARPSEYDRSQAWPWFVYLITSIRAGEVADHRAWQLKEDRSGFIEIPLQLEQVQEAS
ncbi:MAG: Mov34/MPN/PAD-1 family protein [Anaerolineales bacterium]